jgi:hypothetical protein
MKKAPLRGLRNLHHLVVSSGSFCPMHAGMRLAGMVALVAGLPTVRGCRRGSQLAAACQGSYLISLVALVAVQVLAWLPLVALRLQTCPVADRWLTI